MEVEEENTPKHLEGSTTTTVSNQNLLENWCSDAKGLGQEVPESNTQEQRDESSVEVPNSDDPNLFVHVDVAVAGGEIAEDKAVIVQCSKSESDGCGDSVAVESTSKLKDEKDDDEGAVKDEIPTGDVAGEECGGSESTNSTKVDGGESEAVVIIRDNGLHVEEDACEGEMKGVKVQQDDEVLREGGPVDVPLLPVAEIGEREEVMTDCKNDGGVDPQKGSVEIVQGDEATAEGHDDVEDGVHAEVVKEEGIVADEEEALGVGEGIKEEGNMVAGEEVDGVQENDEEEQMVADEEKAVGVEESDEDEPMVADEEELMVADEEKDVSVKENDNEETMMADEEKSLDTELETDEEATMADEEATMADEEKVQDATGMETELPESSIKSSAGKRKRGGKNSKATHKPMGGLMKMAEEDVCFICFDGGELVLCDRRNCPKAYHPTCVNRDEAFFQTKGRWNCGWHLCSICEKKADYMCYTCTYSLCKKCTKTNVISRVREKDKMGFCDPCLKTVMLIEQNSLENQGNVDFNDKSSWEYLFKDYWTDTKAKFNLSLAEFVEAKNAGLAKKQEATATQSDAKDDDGSGSENPSGNAETGKNRKRKAKKRKSSAKEDDLTTESPVPKNTEWASKELLEFVMHMGDGNKSIKSQFDVQALLLEYIKTNNLRDSRRKSQIICDARLERLFGKPRVGHFEMLKLIESHFLIKEDSQIDDIQGSVVDTEANMVDDDEGNETVAKGGKDRKRKMRKKGETEPQSNREDYAAIDIHNISVIYLRRKLVEDLLNDSETFHSRVVGTFVRIRISGANHKQDIYRLVQVTGTTKVAQYAVGKKMTDTMLEILNLDKTESISIDTISNQDFTEDECKRLRQSIKCGLINRLTVGDILDKAMELQVARVNDWLETEVLRLSHLRDRASDLGRKKELRECVEKLQVLKTPEARARKLEEFPVIHVDPTMDPNHESEDDRDEDDKKQDMYRSSVGSRFNRRRDYPSNESWSGTGTSTSRSPGKNYEFSRSLSNNSFTNKVDTSARFEPHKETLRDQGRDFSRSLSNNSFTNKVEDATSARFEPHNETLRDKKRDTIVQPSILKKPSSANDDVASTKDTSETAPKVNETEKMWHYKDPSGKIQGPFSMVQLRKWNNNKYFPADLRIWRKSEKEDNSILLSDALEGQFNPPPQNSHANWATSSVEIPKPSLDERHNFANLPSPTPNQNITGLGQVGVHVGPGPGSYHSGNEGLQSPTPNSSQLATSLVPPQNSDQQSFLPPANSMPAPLMVQPVADQNLAVGPYGWNSGPPHNPQPSPSSMGGQQQLGYNQWGSIPTMVQNPAANFLPAPPPQPNVSWPTMPPNPNMGQIGPAPVNQNMNWGPAVQGPQLTGNVNLPWAMQQPGWVPPPQAQGVAPNQGWVPGPVPMNGNPNWVGPPPPNPGEVQGPPNGWVQGPVPGNSEMGWSGNSNQGWGRGGFSGQKRNQGRGSGYHGNSRRQWEKPGGSFNNNRGGRSNNGRSSDH